MVHKFQQEDYVLILNPQMPESFIYEQSVVACALSFSCLCLEMAVCC